MPWPKTGATHYQLGQMPCIQMVGCLLCSVVRIYEGDVGLKTSADRHHGYRSKKIPQHPIETKQHLIITFVMS